MRQAAIRALEIRDEVDILRGMSRGEFEAHVLDAERAQASAPPEVASQLRLVARAEAGYRQKAADAATRHDHAQATSAQALATRSLPNTSSSKPSTPVTRNGPPLPRAPGKRPPRPRPS